MRLLPMLIIAVALCLDSAVSAQVAATGRSLAMEKRTAATGETLCEQGASPDKSAPLCSAAEVKASSDLDIANNISDCDLVVSGAFNWCDSTCLAAYERVAANSPKCRSSSQYTYTLETMYAYQLCKCRAARADTATKYIPVMATAESPMCTTAQATSWTNAFEFNATYSKCVNGMISSNKKCPTPCLELFEEGVRAAPKCREFQSSYFTLNEKSKERLVKCLTVRGDVVTSNALLKTNSTSTTTNNSTNTANINSNFSESTTTTKDTATTLPTLTPTPTVASDALSATSSLAVVVSCVVFSIAYAL